MSKLESAPYGEGFKIAVKEGDTVTPSVWIRKSECTGTLTDGFENGNWTTDPVWAEEENGTVSAAVVEAAKKTGTYGLRFTGAGDSGESGEADMYLASVHGSLTVSLWIRMSDVSKASFQLIIDGSGDAITRIYIGDSGFFYYDGEPVAFTATPENSTWYRLETVWTRATNLVTYSVYDSSNDLIETHTGISSISRENSALVRMAIEDIDTSTAWTVDVDDVQYGKTGDTYSGNQPRLIVRRNTTVGITDDTVLDTAAAAAGNWEQLSGTTIAATHDGVMEFIIDCDGFEGWINVDDLTTS